MRLIDADALIESYLDHCRTEFEIKNCCMANENVISIIQNAPTFEDRDLFNMGYFEGKKAVKRQKGTWIKIDPETRGYAEFFRCSNCLSNVQLSYWGKECVYDYCPNCGADMRETDDDN